MYKLYTNATFRLNAASFQSEQSQKKEKSHMPDVKAVLCINSLQFLAYITDQSKEKIIILFPFQMLAVALEGILHLKRFDFQSC